MGRSNERFSEPLASTTLTTERYIGKLAGPALYRSFAHLTCHRLFSAAPEWIVLPSCLRRCLPLFGFDTGGTVQATLFRWIVFEAGSTDSAHRPLFCSAVIRVIRACEGDGFRKALPRAVFFLVVTVKIGFAVCTCPVWKYSFMRMCMMDTEAPFRFKCTPTLRTGMVAHYNPLVSGVIRSHTCSLGCTAAICRGRLCAIFEHGHYVRPHPLRAHCKITSLRICRPIPSVSQGGVLTLSPSLSLKLRYSRREPKLVHRRGIRG